MFKKLLESRHFPFLFFFLLLLIPFTAYFLRPNLIGNDGYGFLLLTCQNNNLLGLEGIQFALFNTLPCNILALKVLLFGLCFVAGCFVIKWATLFSPKNGWRASYMMFLSSIFVLEFAKFENDQFAFPFLFASMYFFFKGLKTGARKWYATSFLLLVPAFWLWRGTILMVGIYSLITIFTILAIAGLVFWFRDSFYGIIFRTARVAEDMPLELHLHYVLLLGLFGAVLDPILMPYTILALLLGAASAKFLILSFPFLVVGFVLLGERINNDTFNVVFLIVALFCAIGLAQSIWLNPPTQNHWDAIDFAIEAGDGNVNNDWGMGYWVKWSGGNTSSFGSFLHSKPFVGGIATSEQDLNCAEVKRFGKVGVFQC